MTTTRRPYVTYTPEFKREAVRLMTESDRPISEIAAKLGIRRNKLYKWKEQLEAKGSDAFKGRPGRPLKENQSEMTTLRQENDRLRDEVEILKEAAVCSMGHGTIRVVSLVVTPMKIPVSIWPSTSSPIIYIP